MQWRQGVPLSAPLIKTCSPGLCFMRRTSSSDDDKKCLGRDSPSKQDGPSRAGTLLCETSPLSDALGHGPGRGHPVRSDGRGLWVGGSNTSGLFDESFERRVNRKMTIPTMGTAMMMMWPGSLKTLTARTSVQLVFPFGWW